VFKRQEQTIVSTVETADKYSSKYSSKDNHLKLKTRVVKLRAAVSRSTQEKID